MDQGVSGSADELVAHLRRTLAARAGEPGDVLLHERREPAQAASLGVLRPHLPRTLARALLGGGIEQLYAHQVQAVEALRAGDNVVLASPTASGKSLAFALPTLERLLAKPGRHALYLYPTKALIADQERALRALTGSLEPRQRVAVLTGDTPRHERIELAANPPAIVLANPDILHHYLLPEHARWRRFLAGLEMVVLDELHAYRGVFGAHVALVLRRLRRLAESYGAAPSFVAASATISNPVELAEQVVGAPFKEVHGDAAGSGPRRFVFWRPPVRGDPAANEHQSVLLEAAGVFAEALRAGYTGILFGRARVSVERMLLDVRRLVGPELADQVSGYKAGYRVDERARIEADLRSGRLRGVVSTNALELGIDVGSLDVAVLAGYPGSTMSFWQQAGRVGRRAPREAVVVMVAGDDALDQYHVQHPETFFGQPMEHAAVDPGNASILLSHLLCAASERPLVANDLDVLPPNARGLIDRLVARGELTAGPPWATRGSPAHGDVSLRGTSREPYTLHGPRGPLGTIEPPYLQRECYPNAIYLHNGRAYRVAEISPAARVVRLEDAPLDARTDPLVDVEVSPGGEPLAQRVCGGMQVGFGPLRVRERIVGYVERVRGQAFTAELEQPLDLVLETLGFWLDVPPELEADQSAVHAFEHALVNALPLVLLCDRHDLGSHTDGQRISVFDFVEGGTGLSDKAFHLLDEIVERAAGLVRECPCSDGCPNCLHLAGCGEGNGQLDKVGGLALLEGRSVLTARASLSVLRAGAPPAAARGGVERRRRLREIADAALRERVQAPWLPRPDGLAMHKDLGLVLVCRVDADAARAEVQPLSGAAQSWVEIADLSPPAVS